MPGVMPMKQTLLYNIGTLQTALGNSPACGKAQGQNRLYQDAAILMRDGIICEITENGRLPLGAEHADLSVDAHGALVTPGLIDAHTHLVFGGWRQHEIPLKLQGAGYLDILAAGGGILNTLSHTRAASEEDLFIRCMGFLDEMLEKGVTSCEIKSGYGLSCEHEQKQLQVVRRLKESHVMDVVATFMGAHAIPSEYAENPEKYVDLVCEEMIPRIAEQHLAEYCDVFCETGVFDAQQSRRILLAARKAGLKLKIHADEMDAIGGSQLAGELHATSAEHLIAIEESGLQALCEGGVVAALLPATSFYLSKPYAPARRMIDLGIPVAICSDFNPGSCPSNDLQFTAVLGMLKYKLQPSEVLTALTLNAACAIGMESVVGTAEIGKQGDLVLWDAPDWDYVCYRFGTNHARAVIKRGELVWERKKKR